MGKTWKKRDGHGKGVGNRREKGEEYGHNWKHNSYREYTETDDNSRFNHRSMRKAKEQRRNFEDNFPDLNIEF